VVASNKSSPELTLEESVTKGKCVLWAMRAPGSYTGCMKTAESEPQFYLGWRYTRHRIYEAESMENVDWTPSQVVARLKFKTATSAEFEACEQTELVLGPLETSTV